MALDTLERSSPPIFRQGLSVTSKLVLLALLSILLMASDHRFQISQPLRAGIAVVLSPLQWLSLQPARAVKGLGQYFHSLEEAQDATQNFQTRTIAQAQRLQQVEQLKLENTQLRELLDLRVQIAGPSKAVEVLYETADPYTDRIVVDRGQIGGIVPGSAVIDAGGVVGQITRVYAMVSEVTLLTDRSQAISVINTRTGVRSVAFGQPGPEGDALELRYTLANVDITQGDLLTTSGVDGVYPPGLPVARVNAVGQRAESAFNRISCTPLARVHGALHVLVLAPVGEHLPPSPLQVPHPAVQPRNGSTRP